jgi:putative membrane protein
MRNAELYPVPDPATRHARLNSVENDRAILEIERPHRSLWTYYLVLSLPLPILLLPAWFRYRTMRYRFTDEGISMSWGVLFRREVIINYARIQDIHLRSNILERWLGLARVLVQTASGSASAEMTLEGLTQFEAVRDFLYSRMRGVKETRRPAAAVAAGDAAGGASGSDGSAPPAAPGDGNLAATLRDVCEELRAIRLHLEARPGSGSSVGGGATTTTTPSHD